MFAEIKTLDDLLPYIQDKPEIRVAEQDNGYTVVCYAISDDDTFGGDDSLYARECRGITFNRDGMIAVRPFHKFFNVGEREETLDYNLPWDNVEFVYDKRDGSMITPLIVDGKIVCKSKKTFDSDVAVVATELINTLDNYKLFIQRCDEKNVTAIFEFTSPNNRIVLPYEKPELVLLNVRDNISGEYRDDYVTFANEFYAIPIVEKFTEFHVDGKFSYAKMKEAQETRENVEGWVIQFKNGDMVKAKTAWYLALHRLVVFRSERAIAEMVLDEKIDDMKSAMTATGADMSKIHEIEHRVVQELIALEKTVEVVIADHVGFTRKDFAIKHKEHELFGLLMNAFIGKEPDYAGFFKKFYLKEKFSLDQI